MKIKENGYIGNKNALGHKKSDECKKLIGAKSKGRKLSDEAKKNMSEAALNRSPEAKANVTASVNLTNKRYRSPEERAKVSKKMTGIKRSDETKQKMSDAKKGTCVYYNLDTGKTGSCDVALYRNKPSYVHCSSKACKEDRERRKK